MGLSLDNAVGYDISRYRREVSLEQITGLLHFKGHDEGAYLRPSSVKPQLDRFIFLRVPEQVKDEWRTGTEHKSLSYKLAIAPRGRVQLKQCWPVEKARLQGRGRGHSNSVLVDYVPKSYFVNRMAKNENVGLVYCPVAKLVLESMFPELLDVVESALRAFFLTHNFGIRGGRGNGSFIVRCEPGGTREEDVIRKHCLGYVKLELPKRYRTETLESRLVLSNYASACMDLLRHSMDRKDRWQFGTIDRRDFPASDGLVERIPSPILVKITNQGIYFEYLGYPTAFASQGGAKSAYKRLRPAGETPKDNLLSRATLLFNDLYLDERANDQVFNTAWDYTNDVLGQDLGDFEYHEGTPLKEGGLH
ncbi:MAG: hypothetical protein ACI4B6_07470 [Atopobiaceae bacterium]